MHDITEGSNISTILGAPFRVSKGQVDEFAVFKHATTVIYVCVDYGISPKYASAI